MIEKNLLQEGSENTLVVLQASMLEQWGKDLISQTIAELKPREEKFLKPAEVAKMLKIDRTTLWRWEKAGMIVPLRAGKKLLYKEEDIKKMMKQ